MILSLPGIDPSRRTLAVFSQAYVPDPTSVGQHMHDVAAEMVQRGWQVVVLTSDRGYEDPSKQDPSRERLDGVDVIRLPMSSFGKSSIPVRLAGGCIFLSEAVTIALGLPRIDHVLVSTSPPMCAMGGVALHRLRGVPYTYWAMDLNPDQIVAVGLLAPESMPVRAFDWINRQVQSRAKHVIALDHHMARRLEGKAPVGDKLTVLPPWPHSDNRKPIVEHSENPFRRKLGLGDTRGIMYSGNLSPSHPVTTILEAAQQLQHEERLVFLFIGGGLGRAEIERYVCDHGLRNVRTLPYQPLSEVPYSLAAADVHLVAMGNKMVGIVHPCKIYGAMAAGRPVIALAPRESHLTEIVLESGIGWHVEQGDVSGAKSVLRTAATIPLAKLAEMGRRARTVVDDRFSRSMLLGRFCDVLEQRL